MNSTIQVTVWGENIHEKIHPAVAEIYPDGMHEEIARALRETPGLEVRTATLDQPEHGLTEEILEQTDVLFWWGHRAHGAVEDSIVDRVQARVLQGMGLVALHSAHYAKIFKRLLGTTCSLTWREAGEKERLWICHPGHPLAEGLGRSFEIPHEEMYGEPFAIPSPEEIIFLSWFQGGEAFRSGCTWRRGNGKIFYFRPGHETYPTYHQREVRRVLQNAARWACPDGKRWIDSCPNIPIEEAAEKLVQQGPSLHKPGEAGYR